MRRLLLPGLAVLALGALPAAAQDRGGVPLLPSAIGGPVGLARALPMTFANITAGDIQASVMPDAQQRRQRHQEMITRLRGDGGFLDGFSFGQPLAASRQRVQVAEPVLDPLPEPVIFAPTIIRNRSTRVRVVNNTTNIEGPVAVTVGDGNIVQQQGRPGRGRGRGGSVAQQQVASIGGNGTTGGNSNVALPAGNDRPAGPGAPARRGGAVAQQQVATIGGSGATSGGGNINIAGGPGDARETRLRRAGVEARAPGPGPRREALAAR